MANALRYEGQSSRLAWTVAVAATMLVPAGCKKTVATVDDPTVTSGVQQRIQADGAISTEPIQVSTTGGTVTLTGQVSNNAARTLAANDAATVTGVQKVVNDITVSPGTPPVSATALTPQPMTQPQSSAPVRSRVTPRETREAAPRAAVAPPPVQSPAPIQREQAAVQPPPPPPRPAAPEFRTVTVPAGSVLPVRITQTLDSENAHAGDSFSGSLASDLVEDGVTVLPRGTGVSGTVVDAKDAGHFKGSSLLSIQLTSINRRGQSIAVSTEPFSKEGAGRGKNTAIKTGVGAAAGAVLGGIFGGGKGAAIGTVAGGGTGAGINAVTRGQQVQIPSETIVRFSTTNSFNVRVSNRANAPTEDGLQQRY